MGSLGDTAVRLLLHLFECEVGLTEAELEVRAASMVGTELEALMAAGAVYRMRDRYALTSAAVQQVDVWVAAELLRLGREGALYFAYGSNMDPWQVYLGEAPVFAPARFLCRAELPGHRVVFPRRFPLWTGWVAGVVPAHGDSAWGVLYRVDSAGWMALDRFECVPDDYSRVAVTVSVPIRGASAPLVVPAQTYVHVPDGSAGGPPAASYMARIRRGAEVFALPQSYRAWLDGIATIPDSPEPPKWSGASK